LDNRDLILGAVDAAGRDGYNQAMKAKPKQRVRKATREPTHAVQEVPDDSVDIAALRDNLALTPAERLRRHQIALDRVRWLRKARFL